MVNLFIIIRGIETRIVNDTNFTDMEVTVDIGGINPGVYPEVAPYVDTIESDFSTIAEATNYFGEYNWRVIDQETSLRGRQRVHTYVINKEVA